MIAAPAAAQTPDSVTPERLAARAWFADAKFGLFIHWGVYSELGAGEWVMHNRQIPVPAYEALAAAFDPTKFDAKAWVALARRAGVRYITITSRHHDGFSMFKTAETPYNIVDWTPFKRDPLAELALACHAAGIKLFFYYSQLDWHHPDYWPRGATAWDNGRPASGDWSRYLKFMNAQLSELLTHYGPVGGIWFDGMWDKPDADWHLSKTYALIHQLQPAALIIPNHHQAPKPGEDVQTFERDLPGRNTAGFNTTFVTDQLPLESCNTLNGSWGFDIGDDKYKSVEEIEEMLVRAAGNNSNLLLNIGPQPNGEIQEEFATRLRAVGEWLSKYGVTIYGTRGGPIPPGDWGVTTQKGDTVYVHVLHWNAQMLALPPLPRKVTSVQQLFHDTKLQVAQSENGIVLPLLPAAKGETDRVLVLSLAK